MRKQCAKCTESSAGLYTFRYFCMYFFEIDGFVGNIFFKKIPIASKCANTQGKFRLQPPK